MDGRMDGRTDRPSYRDARTHLKRDGENDRIKGKKRERKKRFVKNAVVVKAQVCLVGRLIP